MTLRRGWRRLTTLGVIAALLAGCALTFAYHYARSSIQTPSGSMRLVGLEDMVTVYFDPFEIPHLFGTSEADVLRAQGFVHASQRLWQLELFQRIARGELAELFGEAALETDRFVRTLDLWGAAGASLEALPPEEVELLQAYAEGVNERIRTWSGAWPPEFLVLRIEPRPWEPRASVAIAKIMALDLSSWRSELSRFVAWSVLDDERYRYLELPYPEWGPTILEPEAKAATARAPVTSSNAGAAARRNGPGALAGSPARRPGPAGLSPGRPAHAAGRADAWNPLDLLSGFALASSNGWAVSGSRARDGFPLLASDMHLPLRAPSTWFLNALHAEWSDLHVAGLSIPGTPGVIVGYSRHVAWAFTNGMVDDMDFAIEAVNLDQSAYRQGEEWLPFRERVDTIRVRGRAEPALHRIRETVRGPVISDVLPNLGATLSLLWTGHRPSTEVSGLLAMNRAHNAAEFDAGVRRFSSPHQNVIYVTSADRLGYRLSGTIPRRREWNGSRPVAAERLPRGWEGTWPADSFPATLDPAAGYLASANNLQRRDLYGVVGSEYPAPFRARRIVDRLSAHREWTTDGMRALQLDTRSLLAERVVDRAAAAARRIGEPALAAALEAWDREVDVESAEATLFHVWLYRLRELIAADEFRHVEEWAVFPTLALLEVLENGGAPWVDNQETEAVETLEGLEESAMREALRWRDARWGEVHRERSAHVLGRVGWLNRLFGFNVGPRPAPGGPHTVRPDDPRRWSPLDSTSWRPPFVSEYGPSERFVAEMGPDESLGSFLLPTGQSGNPLSPHYRDMVDRWPSGDLLPVPLTRAGARALAERTLQLLSR